MSASSRFHWKAFVSFYVVFSFLALAASGIVLYVAPPGRIANWSVWQLLFLSKARWQAVRMKRELAAASFAGAALLAVSIAGVPPFGTVMNVGEDIKNSWSTTSSEPPVPHAELMTVAKLSETVKIPTEKALANLEKEGIKVAQPTMTVRQIADENKLTPQQVYRRFRARTRSRR